MLTKFRPITHRGGLKDFTNKHRQPYPKLAKDVIRVSDIILEVLDVRFLEETRNKELEALIKSQGRFILYVINKCDLVDTSQLLKSGALKDVQPYVLFSCKSALGHKRLRDQIKIEVKRLRKKQPSVAEQLQEEKSNAPKDAPKDTRLLKVNKRAHVGIIGYPNTGKSTLTNILTGRGGANAASEAGFTKGIQKIRFSKDILILDTPGVIEEDQTIRPSKSLATSHLKVGARTADRARDPDMIVASIMKDHPQLLEKYYEVDSADGDPEVLLENIGKRRGLLLKKGIVDTDRVARLILKDWQEGKITKFKISV